MADTEAIGLLRSIDSRLKRLVEIAERRQPKPAAAPAPTNTIATDRDLDGHYGDPELKLMPRDWTGPTFKGRKFSECPPDLLDLVAEMNEYFATQADGKHEMTARGEPVSKYRRADAARARGWAKRIRAGKVAAPMTGTATDPGWATDEWA